MLKDTQSSENEMHGSSSAHLLEKTSEASVSNAGSSDTGPRRRRQPLLSSADEFQSDTDSFVSESVASKKQPSYENSRSAECVVCQTRRVMCVLLPCRHACVCYGCLKLLIRCPMCRGAIQSYFFLSKNDGDETGSSDEDNDEGNEVIHNIEQHAVNASFAEMWERFNMRLNTLLGFR